LTEEKLKQLKKIFRTILKRYLDINEEWKINNLIDELLYAVKVLIDNK